jgi:hypothetical protein
VRDPDGGHVELLAAPPVLVVTPERKIDLSQYVDFTLLSHALDALGTV